MVGRARKQHLSDAEFSDLLAGEFPDDATRFHLAHCEHCRTELDCVRSSLSSFSGLGTRWANHVAPSRIPVPSRWALRLMEVPSWSTGLAMTAATGLLVFFFGPTHQTRVHTPAPEPAPTAVIASVSAPSKSELANDNRLMLSIDQELGYSDQTAAHTQQATSHRVDQAGSVAVIN